MADYINIPKGAYVPPFFEEHWFDDQDNPEGGTSWGAGFAISWQHGPLGTGEARKHPNGAFVETVIGAVIGRLEMFQLSKFQCDENAEALKHLRAAKEALLRRLQRRLDQGVEGTHKGA